MPRMSDGPPAFAAPPPGQGAAVAASALVLAGMAWHAPASLGTWLLLCAAVLGVLAGWLARRPLSVPIPLGTLGPGLLAAAPMLAVVAWQVAPPNLAVGLGCLVAAPGLVLVAPVMSRLGSGGAKRLVVGAAVLGAVIRLLLVVAFPRGVSYPDTLSYLPPAHDWLVGEGLTLDPIRTPGYSAFYLFTTLGGLLGHRLAQAVVLGPILALTLSLWGLRRGVPIGVAAALFAFLVLCPTLLVAETWLLSEPLFTTSLVLSSVALLEGLRESTRWRAWLFAAGLGLGWAVLVRPAAQAALPVAILAIAALVRPRAQAAQGVACLLLGVLLLLGPWCARNQVVHGRPRITLLGGMVSLGAAAHLVDPADCCEPAAAAAVAPAIDPWVAAGDLDAIDDLLFTPRTGLCDRLAAHEPDAARRDDLAGALGREAILRHPLRFGGTFLWRARHYLTPSFRPIPIPASETRDERARAWAKLGRPDVVERIASTWPQPALEAWSEAGAGLACHRLADGLLRALDAALYPVTMLAGFAALALTVRRRGPADAGLLLALGASIQAVAALVQFGSVRYGLPALPLFALALALHARPADPPPPS